MAFAPDIPVRNLKFAVDASNSRYWNGDRKGGTIFWNNLSIFFPQGERFFIESVKRYREVVKDPKLRAEVRAFTAQEGLHTREHLRYNEVLSEQGYPVEELEARLEKLLAVVYRLPDRLQLAVTCALEHFTATLAHMILTVPELMEDAEPGFAALWRWHALEETEHKAVAYDVYELAGGFYLERVVVMFFATLIFGYKIAEHQLVLMKKDGLLFSPSEWWKLGRYLWLKPGGVAKMIPLYLAYYSPWFHPWKHDNRALMGEVAAHVGEGPGLLPKAQPSAA